MDSRKVIIILLLLVGAVLLVVAGAIFFIGGSQDDTSEQVGEGTVSLFPVGGDRATPLLTSATSSDPLSPDPETLIVGTPGLKRLAPGPVSGATFVTTGGTTTIYYQERGSGHIFSIEPEQEFPTRMTNTTWPRIYETHWGQNAGTVTLVTRGLKDGIENVAHTLTISHSATSTLRDLGTLQSALISPNLDRLAVSPDQKNVFYLEATGEGINGFNTTFTFSKPKKIFDHPLRQWEVEWPASKIIGLQSRAAGGLMGSLVALDPTSGKTVTLLKEVPGLVARIAPSGDYIIYSQSNLVSLTTFLYNHKTASTTKLNLATIAEKCLWSKKRLVAYCGVPSGLSTTELPDRWYRGEIGFSDDIWLIDAKQGEAKPLLLLAKNNPDYAFDLINPQLDSREEYLLFTNKRDGSLWILDLNSVR